MRTTAIVLRERYETRTEYTPRFDPMRFKMFENHRSRSAGWIGSDYLFLCSAWLNDYYVMWPFLLLLLLLCVDVWMWALFSRQTNNSNNDNHTLISIRWFVRKNSTTEHADMCRKECRLMCVIYMYILMTAECCFFIATDEEVTALSHLRQRICIAINSINCNCTLYTIYASNVLSNEEEPSRLSKQSLRRRSFGASTKRRRKNFEFMLLHSV